jgi:hypothetical protein
MRPLSFFIRVGPCNPWFNSSVGEGCHFFIGGMMLTFSGFCVSTL